MSLISINLVFWCLNYCWVSKSLSLRKILLLSTFYDIKESSRPLSVRSLLTLFASGLWFSGKVIFPFLTFSATKSSSQLSASITQKQTRIFLPNFSIHIQQYLLPFLPFSSNFRLRGLINVGFKCRDFYQRERQSFVSQSRDRRFEFP